jgi:uncharacterized membrane protein
MLVPSNTESTERGAITDKEQLLALYGAFCLFLSTIEFLIPKPVPFFRLGLANLPILLALRKESPRFILSLVGLKILGQALVNGTLFSYIFVFSTAGSLASGITMTILSFLPARFLSLIGISVMGALSSNLVQILLARYFLLGEGAWLIGPPFLALGTITGILLGGISLSLSDLLSPVLHSPLSRENGTPEPIPPPNPPQALDPVTSTNFPESSRSTQSMGSVKVRITKFLFSSLSPGMLFLTGLASLLPFLFTESLLAKGLLTGFYFLCAGLSGKRLKLVPNLVAFLGITAANLATPLGQVIVYLGTFPVTLGALRLGVLKALTLLGMIALSRFTLRTYVPLKGRLGAVISRMFFYFERITERKTKLRRAHLWEDIRALIEEVRGEGLSPRSQAGSPQEEFTQAGRPQGYRAQEGRFQGDLVQAAQSQIATAEGGSHQSDRVQAGHSQDDCKEAGRRQLDPTQEGRPQAAGPTPTTLKGYAFLVLFLSVSWAALIFLK